ncbi:MAG: hypothetical protein J5986_12010 [Roseburia sp.]|nr:hypothetical protein [Roseburia sp.]
MLLVTSIMNNGNETDLINQRNAVNSWLSLGFRVISTNTAEEIASLEHTFSDIAFVELERTGLEQYGKPVPYISDMLEILHENSWDEEEICGIINSDIYLKNIESAQEIEDLFAEVPSRLVCLHRYDIDTIEDMDGEYYFSGIDAFFLKRKHLPLSADEGFTLGRPEWDHWMVYTALKHDLNIVEVKNALAFHVRHKQRWKASESNAMGSSVHQDNRGEEYYYKTNLALQDMDNRILLRHTEGEECVWDNQSQIYVEEDLNEMAAIEMQRHETEAVRFPLGIGYYKEGKFYRVCVAHRNEYWQNEILVSKRGAVAANVPKAGEVMGYVDFMRTELSEHLGRFYIYSAGRAGKAMLDGLLYHGLRPLGMVDRDENLQGTQYLGTPIYSPRVFKQRDDYDTVLIISNLYIDEIYEELSQLVPKERLVII